MSSNILTSGGGWRVLTQESPTVTTKPCCRFQNNGPIGAGLWRTSGPALNFLILTKGTNFDLNILSKNRKPRKAAIVPFFYPKILSTPLVVGIRKDPGACLRAFRQPMAFLF